MKPESYKAAIFRGPGSVDLVTLPYPECGDDDIIVRNVLTGLCGSDISAYRNGGDDHMIWKDHEFGHEAISEVVEIGKNVTGVSLGDRVFPNQGKALRDPRRVSTVGGFSEFIRIPQCEVGYSILPIGKDIPLEAAVLFEPFVVGARAALNTQPGSGRRAIVFGAGIIGICTAVMLEWYGCAKVMVVDVSDYRLAKAHDLGFATCNPAKEDLKTRACAEFGSQRGHFGERCNADIYVDAIGMKAALDYFEALAPRDATLAVVGVHHQPVQLDLLGLCYSNWRIVGCGSISLEDAQGDILEMMRSNKYDLPSLITHRFSVDEIEAALQLGQDASQSEKICISFAD